MVAPHQVRKDGRGCIMDASRPPSDGFVYGFQDRPRDYEVVHLILTTSAMYNVVCYVWEEHAK